MWYVEDVLKLLAFRLRHVLKMYLMTFMIALVNYCFHKIVQFFIILNKTNIRIKIDMGGLVEIEKVLCFMVKRSKIL